MAANATAVWRVRPSGNNNNGGGFDCAISPAATGTHGSFSGTTFTDATAAAFTSGMVGSAINITGIGQYKITAFISATQITLGSGNPALILSGGQAWTVGSGQDYSQQNAAQVTQSGGTVSTSTTTLTDTGAAFTSALIGNAIRVAGTGITTTYTYITAVPSSTTLTLQTSPGTTGTSVTYNIGGGWADFWTNTSQTAPIVIQAGNIVYILGSGVPNPASYTYDYDQTVSVTMNGGGTRVLVANDPATPSYKAPPDTTGGMPVIKFDQASAAIKGVGIEISLQGTWFVGTTSATNFAVLQTQSSNCSMVGCVLDQFGFDCVLAWASSGEYAMAVIGCEGFSSVTPGSTGTHAPIFSQQTGTFFVSGCNFHDCVGYGINSANGNFSSLIIVNSIIAKCRADGILWTGVGGGMIQNCTIDGNLGHGINLSGSGHAVSIFGNIISNQTTAGKFGVVTNSVAELPQFFDYNVYYNNTGDLSNLQYGPHDTHPASSNPYVGQTTENYTLA